MGEKKKKQDMTEWSDPVMGQPENAFDLINKYGTYEIQPTEDSGNAFPTIASGLAKRKKEKYD